MGNSVKGTQSLGFEGKTIKDDISRLYMYNIVYLDMIYTTYVHVHIV